MAGSLSEIQSVMQNGVTAINNLTAALNGVFAGSGLTTTGGGGTSVMTTSKMTPLTMYSTSFIPIVAASSARYGILFHNPSTTDVYIFQNGTTPAPNPSLIAGTFVIHPGGTLTFPSAYFPNINAGFTGFSVLGSSTIPFTVMEFF
jgi:hypothetical protein